LEHSFGHFQVKVSEDETRVINTGMTVENTLSLKESFEEKMS